jgi:hypothetical protein
MLDRIQLKHMGVQLHATSFERRFDQFGVELPKERLESLRVLDEDRQAWGYESV